MRSDNEEKALARIQEFLREGRTLDEIRDAGWGGWLDHFEANQVDMGAGPHVGASEADLDVDAPDKDTTASEAALRKIDSFDPFASVKKRYAALGTIGTILQVLGWIVLIGGVLISILYGVAVAAVGTDEEYSDLAVAAVVAGSVLASVVWGLMLIAVGEVIQLLIDVEQNTRATAVNTFDLAESDAERA